MFCSRFARNCHNAWVYLQGLSVIELCCRTVLLKPCHTTLHVIKMPLISSQWSRRTDRTGRPIKIKSGSLLLLVAERLTPTSTLSIPMFHGLRESSPINPRTATRWHYRNFGQATSCRPIVLRITSQPRPTFCPFNWACQPQVTEPQEEKKLSGATGFWGLDSPQAGQKNTHMCRVCCESLGGKVERDSVVN